MDARSRWTEPSNVMYDPNPYSRPAENAAGHHFHPSSRDKEHRGGLSSRARRAFRRLNDATGPERERDGRRKEAQQRDDVFEARFTPREKSM